MPTVHIVKPGDCISSIAYENGYGPATLWDADDNADLREKRGDPNVLLPGDKVVLPDKETRTTTHATGKRYTFVRRGVPEKLKLEFLLDDKPRAGEPYVLEINGVVVSSDKKTDGEGRIEHAIPPNARSGRVLFRDGKEVYDLRLGHLDPIEEVRGVKGRLKNLGFYHGAIDDTVDEATEIALAEFQESRGLEAHGDLDDETRSELKKAYGG
jgi:Putative peptidoglycan binding domain